MKNCLSRRHIVIFIIPLIVLGLSFLLRLASGPFWQFGDPCFNYYFNALLLIKGHVPVDITHPGTPLQVLVALMVWILNFGRPIAEMVGHALINPEFYLTAVYVFLQLSIFLTSILLAASIYRKTGDILPSLLTQLPILSFLTMPSFDNSSFPVIPVSANISAEPVLMIVMNLFNLFLLRLYFAETKSQRLLNVLLLALVCGLGLATKINFLIILLSALMLVPLQKKILFVLVCTMSFIFCTIPIFEKYPQLFQWITGIVSHSSRYGTGNEKFIDWNSFFYFLKMMIRLDWFFIFSAFGLCLWSCVGLIKNPQDIRIRFIGVLTFACLLQIAATAKHFSFHYLLPCIALFSSIYPLYYLSLKDKIKILKPLTVLFILIFSFVCIFSVAPYIKKLMLLRDDIRSFNSKIKSQYPQCKIIPTTTGDIDLFLNDQEVLQRANGTNFRLLSDDLFNLNPQSYYFFSEEVTDPNPNVESYGIWNFKQRVFADDLITSCPCSIFIKFGSDLSSYPYQVRLLDQSKYLSAFLLVSSTEKLANDLFARAIKSANNGEYQQALMLGLKSRELNYKPRSQLEYILAMIYRELIKTDPNLLNQKQ